MEFSYPPLMPDEGHDSNLLPEEWKYLPFVALPDGAHNFQEGKAMPRPLRGGAIPSQILMILTCVLFCLTDTVFFHLPPLSEDMKCVYGVSCYRQIEAKVRDGARMDLLVILLVVSPSFLSTSCV